MQCVQCGADLRPNARFCRVCGAAQPTAPEAQVNPPVVPTLSGADDGEGGEAGRVKRPPRVPRNQEDEGASAFQTAAPAPAPTPFDEEEPVFPPSEKPKTSIGVLDATSSADTLPWPLPLNLIVGGRYRIEAVVSAAATEADANIYRVTDLQGYERCWSCGADYTGEEKAPERFCRECGADMLSREYLMRERLATDASDEATEEPAADDLTQRAFTQGKRRYEVALESGDGPLFPTGAHIVAAAASDIGRDRAAGHNEDCAGLVVLELTHDSYAEPLALCVVADGLGGHASGQEASRLVARTMLDHVLRHVALPLVGLLTDAPSTEEGLKHVLNEGVQAANTALCSANAESKLDMGSTVVAALIFGGTAYLANVGDSRAYTFDKTGLRQITTDHSLVQQLIAGGMISSDERYTHPNRNQITRSLGVHPSVDVDFFAQQLRPSMRLLLCSDGLWEMVRDDEIAAILRDEADPQAACDALVAAANTHGGEDNITALVIEVGA